MGTTFVYKLVYKELARGAGAIRGISGEKAVKNRAYGGTHAVADRVLL